MREVASRVPPVARPLAFVVGPLIILHALFMRTPDIAPTPLVPAGAVPVSGPKEPPLPSGISTDTARDLVERSPQFTEEKRMTTPRYVKEDEVKNNAMLKALSESGMVTFDASGTVMGDMKVELTRAAEIELGTDAMVDPTNITIAVAKRKMERAWGLQSGGDKDSVAILFSWHWEAVNKVGRLLNVGRGSRNGTAWLRKNGSTWTVVKVDAPD